MKPKPRWNSEQGQKLAHLMNFTSLGKWRAGLLVARVFVMS
jgi:hypothetical protein